MKKVLIFSLFALFYMPLAGCGGHTHSLTEWQTKTPATCESAEVLERYCISCDFKETKAGSPKRSHNYSTQIITPSLTQTGYTRHYCDCGDEYFDTYKCLIVFENTTENVHIQTSNLPNLNNVTVDRGYEFTGVSANATYKPVSYTISILGGQSQTLTTPSTINDSCKITIMWDLVSPYVPSEDEIVFNEIIEKIEKLEEISLLYNQTKGLSADANLRVMQYIRNTRYNDDQWNGFGGTLEADFVEFVADNQGSLDLSSLQSISNFVVPSTGAKVDFVHMIAILNVIVSPETTATNIYDLVGFGGDLAQLAVEVKNSNPSVTAAELFMNNSSSFSSYDLYADIDAVNLAAVYNNMANKTLSGAMKEYYTNLTLNAAKASFISNTLSGLDTSSVANLAADIVSRLKNNLYMQMWASQNGLNFTTDASIILECATCFADYLI